MFKRRVKAVKCSEGKPAAIAAIFSQKHQQLAQGAGTCRQKDIQVFAIFAPAPLTTRNQSQCQPKKGRQQKADRRRGRLPAFATAKIH
ncbi:MAG: hypothetical protein NTV22_19690 [bacterium]|nr:hypothetical protein [bacterium]